MRKDRDNAGHRTDRKSRHWVQSIHDRFTSDQREKTTLLVSGLTPAHDAFVAAALRGMGYRVMAMDCPDNAAMRIGKEFGNRAQCNPTYFTVGNLLKFLMRLRDEEGISTPEIIDNYIFVTAGSCGPCRFGMYVTEYRKALRDAGFEGFRVLLFQQQGGLKQAVGRDLGLVIDKRFALQLVRAFMAGDVLNLLAYRMRPYEVKEGSCDEALAKCRAIIVDAFTRRRSVTVALFACRRILGRVELDRLRPKPVVSIIGEFWAMTTEGDGSYRIQRFLESEGAEVDIQGVTNWLLYLLWESRYDRLLRLELRRRDAGHKSSKGKNPHLTLLLLKAVEHLVRLHFRIYASALGLRRYPLPDMEHIAELANPHYDNTVRGGEGHMEVGKLIHFEEDRVNHMTISVKPFGCMPSSGVSDGVQSLITARYPNAVFLPVETTGDGQINAHSRIQMMLFKARQKVSLEYDKALEDCGLSEQALRARLGRKLSSPFYLPPHRVACQAANLVHAASGKRPGGRGRFSLRLPTSLFRPIEEGRPSLEDG